MAEMLLMAVVLSCVWDGSQAMSTGGDSTCQFGESVYQVGDKWHPKVNAAQAKECINCTCHKRGEIRCVGAKCPKPDCNNPKYVHGKCCPVCQVVDEVPGSDVTDVPGCTFFDTHYEDGARFPSNRTSYTPKYDNQCVLCDCFRGKVTCHVKTCLHDPYCIKTTSVPDDCCPSCQEFVPDWEERMRETVDGNDSLIKYGDCLTPGGPKENGTKWKPEVTHHGVVECVICQCKNGHVICSSIRCPMESALKCKRPQRRRGDCCRECYPGKRRKGRKNGRKGGGKRGDKNNKKKKKKKKKGNGRGCKKAEGDKEKRKTSRRRRCKNKGSRRKDKARKRKDKKVAGIETSDVAIPLDTVVSDVIETLCLPKRTERLVYLIKTESLISLALDGVKDNVIEQIQWHTQKGRIELTQKNNVLDPSDFRSEIKVRDILGATTKRNMKKFLKKLDRKQKKCKKKCKSKMLNRIFKRLKAKKLDLKKRCRV